VGRHRLLFVDRPRRRWPLGLLALALLGGCAWWAGAGRADDAHTATDATRPAHHTAQGFRNRDGSTIDKSQWEVWRWQLTRRDPPRPTPPLPAATPDLQAPTPNLTWIGHATALVRTGALTILTDPQFSERASPFTWAGPRRLYPPPLTVAQLPRVDVVLISHNHYDHLDEASVRALAAQPGGAPLFVVPLRLKAWFDALGLGLRVVELDWWQSHTEQGVEFVLTPAKHWSSRTPFDRQQTLWGGFAVLAPDLHLLYTGDTGYSRDFADIRQHFAARHAASGRGGFDLALIPVGCYEPREFMRAQHVNPMDAAQIHLDLGTKRSVGVHWGTFEGLCDEPLDQAPRDLATARQQRGIADDAFTVLRRGETLSLAAR
jgi:N-acyl-phosphatidylethanolamine-hydrolysing phospholipase D